MAITYVGAGAIVYSTGNPSPAAPAHLVGDTLIAVVATKPDTTPATTPVGWTLVGAIAGGAGTTGNDTGPMRIGVFMKKATGTTDSTGAITVTGNNVTGAQVFAYRVPAGKMLDIAFTGAADTSAPGDAPFTATMPLNPGLTVGDELLAIGVIPTDAATFTAQSVAATGMTTVSLTEINEINSTTGGDIGGWIARGVVATGTSSAPPVISSTAAGTLTNVAGPLALLRLREVNMYASDTGSLSATESTYGTVLGGSPSVIETVQTGVVANGPMTATLTTTPQFGDKILVVYRCHLATGVRVVCSISGLNAKWSNVDGANGQGSFWIGEGANVSGNITVTQNSAAPMSLTVYLIRNLNSTNATFSVVNNNGGSIGGPTIMAGLGQIFVSNLVGYDPTLGDITYPAQTELPTSDDWVYTTLTKTATTALGAGYRIPTGAQVNHQTTSDGTLGDTHLLYGIVLGDYIPPVDHSRSDSGTISATESATVVPLVSKAGSDSGTITSTEASSLYQFVPAPEPYVVEAFYTPQSSTTLSVNSGTTEARVDDMVLFVFMSSNNATAMGTPFTNSTNVVDKVASSGATGISYLWGRVTSDGTVTASVSAGSSAASVGILYIIRGADLDTAPLPVGAIAEEIDFPAYFDQTIGDNSMEVVFYRTTDGAGITTDYGTPHTDIADTAMSSYTYGSAHIDERPVGSTSYQNTIEGYFLGSTSFFGFQFAVRDASPTITWPTIRDAAFSESSRTTTPHPSVPLDVKTGDILVVKATSENSDGSRVSGVSGGGLTWTERVGVGVSAGWGEVSIWTATATSDTTITITTTWTGGSPTTMKRSILAESWKDAKLATTPATVQTTSGGAQPQATITTTAANSMVSWVSMDWSANAGTPVYRDSAVQERYTGTTGTDYRAYYAYQLAGTAGSQTFGMTAPDFQSSSLAGIEIQYQAPGGGSTPISGTDTGTFSATDTAEITVVLSRADSGTFSVTDTGSVQSDLATKSASDSGTFSATDTSANASALSRADAGTLSATDTSGNILTSSLADGGTLSATDTSQTVSTIGLTDSGTFSVNELVAIQQVRTIVDSGTLSATESATIYRVSNTSDSGTLSSTDDATVAKNIALSDTGTISATDTASLFIAAAISANDTGTLSATDTASIVVVFQSLSLNDSGTFSATETRGLASASTLTDSGTLSATDTSVVFKTVPLTDSGTLSATTESAVIGKDVALTDTGTLSATDTASVFVFAAVIGSDAGTFSATESLTSSGTMSRPDTGTFSATESATVFKVIDLSDSGTISATDTAGVFQDRLGADSGTFTAVDAASVQIFGTISKAGSDSGTLVGSDAAQTISLLALSDTGTLSAVETATGTGTTTANDSGTISAADVVDVFKTLTASDSGTLSATEASSKEEFEGTQMAVWNGSEFVFGTVRVWDGNTFIYPTVRVWNGSTFVLMD